MSRTYRLSDFQGLLREHSDSSTSRRPGRADHVQWDRGSRESAPIERQNRGGTRTAEPLTTVSVLIRIS